MSQELYFEDFYVGQKMNSLGSAKVTAEEIKEFGQKYDPQPFHLDEAAGEGSFFKGLAASGWLTAAIVMRLRVQSITVAGGMIGAGVEEMRWTEPVRPGDSIRTEIEVVGVRHVQLPQGLRRRPHPHPGLSTSATRSSCAAPSTSSPHSATHVRAMTDDRTRLPQIAASTGVVILRPSRATVILAKILFVFDEGDTPDLFCLEVEPGPDGAYVEKGSSGHSVLLSDIARRPAIQPSLNQTQLLPPNTHNQSGVFLAR